MRIPCRDIASAQEPQLAGALPSERAAGAGASLDSVVPASYRRDNGGEQRRQLRTPSPPNCGKRLRTSVSICGLPLWLRTLVPIRPLLRMWRAPTPASNGLCVRTHGRTRARAQRRRAPYPQPVTSASGRRPSFRDLTLGRRASGFGLRNMWGTLLACNSVPGVR